MCVYPKSLKKKVEFLQRTLSTPTRTNEALSRLVFERCVTTLLDWNLYSFHLSNLKPCVIYQWGFCAYLSARPQWSWSSLTSTSLQTARTLTSTWLTTSLRQMMWPRNQHILSQRRCGSIHQRTFDITHCGNVCVDLFWGRCVSHARAWQWRLPLATNLRNWQPVLGLWQPLFDT